MGPNLGARPWPWRTMPGRHSDGGGLYLSIDKNQRRRWTFLFTWQGRLMRTWRISGSLSLDEARAARDEARNGLAIRQEPDRSAPKAGCIITRRCHMRAFRPSLRDFVSWGIIRPPKHN